MNHFLTALRRYLPGLLVVVVIAEMLVRLWVASVNPAAVGWYDASAQLRIGQLEADVDPEVVFAGTSMAWQAFVPSAFTEADPLERSAFNVGLDGGIPQVTGPWLQDHVLERSSPDLVVWGVSSLDLSPGFGDGAVERYNASFEGRPDVIGRLDRAVSSFSSMVAWRRVLRDPAEWQDSEAERELTEAASTVGPGGERRQFTADKSNERLLIQRARLADPTPDPEDLAAFASTIATLVQSGTRVVVVILPVPPSFVEAHPGGAEDLDERRATLQAIAASVGADVFDFTGHFGEDDFTDFSHLNEQAARSFSRRFAEVLSAPPGERFSIGAKRCDRVTVKDDFGFDLVVTRCS